MRFFLMHPYVSQIGSGAELRQLPAGASARTHRNRNRWPVAVVMNVLNAAAVMLMGAPVNGKGERFVATCSHWQ